MDYITRKAVYTGGMPQRQTMGILQKQIRLVRGNNEDNTLDGVEEGTKGAHLIIDDTKYYMDGFRSCINKDGSQEAHNVRDVRGQMKRLIT
jgi:hypothetical protein